MPLAEAAASTQNMWSSIMMIGIAVVFFYFILWRPERKRRKAMEEKRRGIQKGDEITAMGIIGKVVKVDDATVTISTADSTKIEMLKAAVTEVTASKTEAKA